MYKKNVWDVADILRGSSMSASIMLASFSLKYVEQEFEERLSNEARLSYLVKDAVNAKENIKKAFKIIEKQISELQGVYEKLNIDWDSFDNKTIFETMLSVYKTPAEEFSEIVHEIRNWAMRTEGKKGGEHLIPNFLNQLMVTLLDIKAGNSFYDGAAGYGGSMIEVKRQHPEKTITLYGQELNPSSWAAGKLCLLMSGAIDAEFEQGNTLTNPLFLEGNKVKNFDCIAMAIPLSLRLDEQTQEKLSNDTYQRFSMGDLPRNSADMAFIQHALSSLKDRGKAIITVTNGVLSRSGPEQVIRQNLIDTDQIEAVISLAPNLLMNTAIPISLLILNKNKPEYKQKKVQFIQASELFQEQGRIRYLTEEHISKIHQALENAEEVEGFSKYVPISDLEESLTVARYIQSNEFEIDGEGTFRIHINRLGNDQTPLVEINSLGKIYRGLNITSKTVDEVDNGEFKVIKLSDVQDGAILMDELSTIEAKTNFKTSLYQVQEGDVIISSKGSNIKIAVVPEHEGAILLSQNFIGFRSVKNKLYPHFLQAYLESPIGKYQLSHLMIGTAMPVLNPKNFGSLQISLPSLDLQEAVAKRYKLANERYKELVKEAEQQLKSEKRKAYEEMGIHKSFELLNVKS
ncbi:N-6 DNA methylase [Domibacillus sp. PGB-M46]|uniref:N-6 DNA methylase n=1 Tax=Domibacillus sp. PGB-M46 TaxID=2910255 RepID=UPI001F56A430|nr:N-6 DNA methylase [Domibacillus sp. PGB-M46]MCI2255529.1 N-6 DNA methylase [Domibacillus sp. PGB-M46]